MFPTVAVSSYGVTSVELSINVRPLVFLLTLLGLRLEEEKGGQGRLGIDVTDRRQSQVASVVPVRLKFFSVARRIWRSLILIPYCT